MWKRRILRYLLPGLVFIVVCAIQVTVWPALFGTFVAPPFWLLVIIWLSLYRPQPDTVLFLYALGLIACSFTAMPLKMMLSSILLVHLAISHSRERVFWSGSSYFVLASIASVTLYHVCYLALSRVLEPSPAAWLPLERLGQILLAVPAAAAIYPVMRFMERPLATETRVEGGAA